MLENCVDVDLNNRDNNTCNSEGSTFGGNYLPNSGSDKSYDESDSDDSYSGNSPKLSQFQDMNE